MTQFGELYDKLVVMPGQRRWSAYYMLVQDIIEEMAGEFPMRDNRPFSVREIDSWFEKWFGLQSLGETVNE